MHELLVCVELTRSQDVTFHVIGQDPFLVGVGISVYQNSGGPGSQWEHFETQKNWFGQSVIEVGLNDSHYGLQADSSNF